MSAVHICCPATTAKTVHAGTCPDCKKRTRFLAFFQPWYGWHSTCLRCGRSWDDGHWLELNFERDSRQKSIERAKVRWRSLPPVSENHYGLDMYD